LNISERGYTDLVAEKDGQCLRIEIEHRTTKDQIEKNIRKNLEYKIAKVDELKKNGFKEWFEVGNK